VLQIDEAKVFIDSLIDKSPYEDILKLQGADEN